MSALDHPVFAGLRSGIGELVELLQELVRCHPLYGTAGQEAALDLTAQYLHGIGFDVRRRTVQPKTMQSSPHYVDVPAFGESFASYPSMERTSVRGLKVFSAPGPRIVLNGHLDVEFVTSPRDLDGARPLVFWARRGWSRPWARDV